MRRGWLAAVLVLASEFAGARQTGAQAPRKASAVTAQLAAPAANPVTVYSPRHPVKAPKLLPWKGPLEVSKNCTGLWTGEPELSLLVDTEGRARNVMVLRPAGTIVDRLAVAFGMTDRFPPGTLKGKPVVVAESLQVNMEACRGLEKGPSGKLGLGWLLLKPVLQKLKKPKNPPQVAAFAPLETPPDEIFRKVDRPDFFGNGESAPVLIYSKYADYTPFRPGMKGTCEVSLVVDEHGLPENLHLLKGIDPGLDSSALKAVENYRFFPANKDDKPVPAAVVVSVKFAPPLYYSGPRGGR